jgi:hypothetical protein
MNIGLGIYEIFARIIPGTFYILAVGQLGFILKLISFDLPALNNLGLIPSIGLVIMAYILSTAFYPISILWHRLFKPKNAPEVAFIEFQKRNPNWKFEFEGKDWRMLFASIHKEDADLANAIEKQNAFYIMLASISFAIILLVINQIILFFLHGSFLSVLYAVLLLVISLLIAREARFFQSRFYYAIFETVLSYESRIDDLVKRNSQKASHESKKK